MINASVSADIIASTSLSNDELKKLTNKIHDFFALISSKYNKGRGFLWARLVKGDYVECITNNPNDALRIALLLKCWIKSFVINEIKTEKEQIKKRAAFSTYGIRIAIGIGEMDIIDTKKGILSGDAIFRSGRKLEEHKTSNKEKIIIKNTLFFDANDEQTTLQFSAILALIDVLLNKATSKQNEILFWKLYELTEAEVAGKLKLGQSTINQQSTSAGWLAIDKAVKYYEQYVFQ